MSQSVQTAPINEDKMQAFLGKVITDFGASLSSVLAYIGTKLGLYQALAQSNGLTPAELAEKTGTTERYVREWLLNQAAGEYVYYDPATGKYSLLPEQAVALTDETSPFYVGGGFHVIKAMMNAQPRIAEAFKTAAECSGASTTRTSLSEPKGSFGRDIPLILSTNGYLPLPASRRS